MPPTSNTENWEKYGGGKDLKLLGPKSNDNFGAFAAPYQRFLPKFHEANDDFRLQFVSQENGF